MNLTLHLVLNDFRRMRVWLIGWIGMLVFPLVIGFLLVTRDRSIGTEWNLPDMIEILAQLQIIFGYMLSLVLLHEHRVVGTNQFWLTRPISRKRLLVAKTIGLFLMVGLLPVIVALPWWLWCGFNAAQVMNAAVETVAVMMLVALGAAVMAVLTDSFSRALLWSVVFVAVLLFGVLYHTIVNAVAVKSDHESSLVLSRTIVAAAACAAVMLAVVVTQFLVRRRGWWLPASGALAVALVLLASHWPWGLFPDDPVEFNTALADGVKLRFDRAIAEPLVRERRPGQEIVQELRTHFTMSGVPKGLDAHALGGRHEWRSSAFIIRRDQLDWWVTVPFGGHPHPDPETERWLSERSAKEAGTPLVEGETGVRVSSHFQPSIMARLQSDLPVYHAKAWWQLMRWQFLFQLPLRAGERVTRDGRGVRVARVERGSTELAVRTVETRPVTIRGFLDEIGRRAWYRRRGRENLTLSQVRRGRDEAANELVYDRDDERRVIINGVEIALRRRIPRPPGVIRNGKWEYGRPNFDGDTLSVTMWKEMAVFSREVTVERLHITNKQ